jgi:hypothetical protein
MSRARDQISGDLFTLPQPPAPVPASMDYRAQVSHLVSEMLAAAHAAGIDRYEVAARASRLAGRDVSKAMLDGYTSEAREEFNLPFWLVPVLETVCSSTRLTQWLAGQRGGVLKVGAETLDAEIGRTLHERDRAGARLRELQNQRRKVR